MARAAVRTLNQTRNYLINGGMEIWQRGTSFNITNNTKAYTADRWFAKTSAGTTNVTVSRQVDVPSNFSGTITYSAKIQRNSGNTNTNLHIFGQGIESVNHQPLRNQIVTVGFWIKAGANFSGSMTLDLSTTNNIDDDPTNYSGATFLLNNAVTPTTSWQYVTMTTSVAVGTSVGSMRVVFRWTPSGTAGADDSFYVTGFTLNEGTQAQLYKSESFERNLQSCQRYYETGLIYARYDFNPGASATIAAFTAFAVPKRASPAGVITANNSSGDWGPGTQSIAATSVNGISINYTMLSAAVTPRTFNISWTAEAEL